MEIYFKNSIPKSQPRIIPITRGSTFTRDPRNVSVSGVCIINWFFFFSLFFCFCVTLRRFLYFYFLWFINFLIILVQQLLLPNVFINFLQQGTILLHKITIVVATSKKGFKLMMTTMR